ncbi:MAG: cupredoxin domain-containing protein [Thermomicrobiales bacterium]|nr:cupredoxin domain-containing protein [Thermomicrobiales bacterium]
MARFHGWRSIGFLSLAGLALSASVTACGGGDSDEAEATAAAQGKTAEPSPAGGPIEIVMTDNKFDPADFTIPLNTEIEITVDNQGAAIHNMHIVSQMTEGEDFASENIVRPGTTSTFTVKFTKAGTYEFLCDFHLTDMKGTLTVQ